jgi:hypothetical protein
VLSKPPRKTSRLRRWVEAILGCSLIATTLNEHPATSAERFGYWQSLLIGVVLIGFALWETLNEKTHP